MGTGAVRFLDDQCDKSLRHRQLVHDLVTDSGLATDELLDVVTHLVA
jgi:hypothetical protein